jgi:hypothetical protein
MHIQSHKVSLTPGEVEIIGDAICEGIRHKAIKYKEKEIPMDDFADLHEQELDLLNDLTQIGYLLWISYTDEQEGRLTTSPSEWIESLKVV